MTNSTVFLHVPAKLGAAASFGVQELRKALEARGYRVSNSQPQYTISIALESATTLRPGLRGESFSIARPQPDRVDIVGSDENGVLYGCLDLAEQLAMGCNLADAVARSVTPDLQVRGLYTFLHNPESERDWLYDPAYWQAYADQLARDRYNRFNLIFGLQSPHLIPIYAFMLDDLAAEYPQIQVKDITPEERGRNLRALQVASAAMNSRGLTFFLGIWASRPWTIKVGLPTDHPTRVTGVDDLGLLTLYTRRGVTRLMELCPDIKGIQLRINLESGVGDQRFFVQSYVPALKELAARGRRLTVELRSWGLLPDTIEAFRSTGLDIVLSCKYFDEHQAMPNQPPVTRGSYSYDSFLRKDKPFPWQWHLWNLGSHRLFAWGDPDWARRFGQSCHLADGVGFEVTPPGSQKGYSEWGYVFPGDWQARSDLPKQWDFQRYWFFHSAFGRMGYDPNASDDFFVHELATRTTVQAAPTLFSAYKAASQVISYLISMRMDDPNMYVWPELDCGGPIDHNTIAPPGEETLFATARQYAQALAAGTIDARRSPFDQATDLERFADSITAHLKRLDAMPGLSDKLEYRFVSVDFKALAALSSYHAAKQRASGNLALFYVCGDRHYLDLAEVEATHGVKLWEDLCADTQVYYHKLHFGPSGGHWNDNLPRVKRDVRRLQRVRELFDDFGLFVRGFDFGRAEVQFTPDIWKSGLIPEPRFSGVTENDAYTPEKGFGWLQTGGIRAHGLGAFVHEAVWGTHRIRPDREYDPAEAETVPLDGLTNSYLSSDVPRTFRVDLPDGDYKVTLVAPASAGVVTPVRIGSNTLSIGRTTPGVAHTYTTVEGGKLDIAIGEDGPWVLAAIVIQPRAPQIGHLPPLAAEVGKDLTISATAMAPDTVASLCLSYKAKGRAMTIRAEGPLLRATVPAGDLAGASFAYTLAAEDGAGHITQAGPYTVPLVVGYKPPRVTAASGPTTWSRSSKLAFSVTLDNAAFVREVIVHYREADQNREFRTATLQQGPAGEYMTQIDAQLLDDDYELIYYFEVLDVMGRGSFYPDPLSDARYRTCKPL